jgi:hypothetical protein
VYVKDLMRYYRTEDFEPSSLSATYPFREDALRLLISNLTARTPHNINQSCAEVIETALKQGIIYEAGKGTIDMPFVQSVEDQRVRFDMG